MNNDVLDIISEYLSNISSNIMEYQEQVFCLWSTEKEKLRWRTTQNEKTKTLAMAPHHIQIKYMSNMTLIWIYSLTLSSSQYSVCTWIIICMYLKNFIKYVLYSNVLYILYST